MVDIREQLMAESDIEGKAQRIAAYAGPGMSISASLQNATAMAKELPDLKEKLFDIRLQYARQTSNRLQEVSRAYEMIVSLKSYKQMRRDSNVLRQESLQISLEALDLMIRRLELQVHEQLYDDSMLAALGAVEHELVERLSLEKQSVDNMRAQLEVYEGLGDDFLGLVHEYNKLDDKISHLSSWIKQMDDTDYDF